jgi:signal transduction histidine kinase
VRRRILATIMLVTAFAVLAFFVPATLSIRSRIQRSDLLELQREASIVATDVAQSGNVPSESTLDQSLRPGHELAVYRVGDGTKVVGEGPAVADDLVRSAFSGLPIEGYVGGDLVAAAPMRDGNVVVAVARVLEPRSESDARVRRSVLLLGLAGIGIIAVAGVIGALLSRRLSRPVEQLRGFASTIGRDDAGPPPAATGISELDELGGALTDAGDRIRELLRRERSFSSHVSHQLRTPVAAMRVAIEAELDAPRPDSTTVLHESLRALDRLESTIESMLALARHDERSPAWCDVGALVSESADRWRPSYAAAGRDVTVRAATQPGEVDAVAVGHILDVLLENALVHGRGPVVVNVRRNGASIEVDVGDDGPSDPGADPFSEVRVDTSHGIGLRLARTLAESEGGQLRLLEVAPTTFRLSLPVPA